MSQDAPRRTTESMAKPLNIVLGGAGIGLLLAAAGFAFTRSQKTPRVGGTLASKAKIGIPFDPKGRWAISTMIKVIEHDASRKVLLSILKAMAKRSK